jgi:acyl-CoA thioester hydrolase
MPPAFRTTRVVEFGDTDMAGIVHFANFFRYMEAAEHAFLRSLGLSVVLEFEGEKYGLPRVSASCDYIRPARFGEVLTITLSVAKLGRSSIAYTFDFKHNEEAIARGSVTAVFCRFAEGGPKACEMPETFRLKLAAPMAE